MNTHIMSNEKIYWFIFYNDQLLIEKKNGKYQIPYTPESPLKIETDISVLNVAVPEHRAKTFRIQKPISVSDQYEWIGLRSSYDYLPQESYNIAGKAFEILHWDKNSRFCPVCGNPMEFKNDMTKRCLSCGKELYPTISTAILVLIR